MSDTLNVLTYDHMTKGGGGGIHVKDRNDHQAFKWLKFFIVKG